MTGHWDAAAVAVILGAVLVLADVRHTRTARARCATHRALRDRDRAAYWRLWHLLHDRAPAGQPPAELAADEPIPYLPVWTSGALDDDLADGFDDLINHAYREA